jgi:hypothetical protein
MDAIGWQRGIAWKNDKLYAFEPGSIVVMRLWPDMLAWRRTRTKPWSPTRKWADQVLRHPALEPGYLERYHHLRHAFGGPPQYGDLMDGFKLSLPASMAAFSTIPDGERQIASKFTDRRWHVLALMARCPGAADLLEANPALGFALANSWVLRDAPVAQPMRSARALIRKSQACIMEWLGFEPSERVRRILRRIEPAALSGRALPQLRRALANPQVQEALAHLPNINAEILPFVTHPDSMAQVTTRFLRDVLEQAPPRTGVGVNWRESSFCRWIEIRRMSSQIDLEPPRILHELSNINRWHALLVKIHQQDRETETACDPLQANPTVFPPAPFQDVPGIEAILTSQSLWEEGRTMRHCVANYRYDIEAGRCAVYRVTDPCRATLSLTKQPSGWVLDEIRGLGNQRIKAADRNRIISSLMARPSGESNA